MVEQCGVPDALEYNAAIIQSGAVGDLTAQQHLDAWAVNVVGAITTAAHVVPAMAERGTGSFIITGGMPAPKRGYVSRARSGSTKSFTEWTGEGCADWIWQGYGGGETVAVRN